MTDVSTFPTVILLEDDDDLRESVADGLSVLGIGVDAVGTAAEFYRELAGGRHRIAIVDLTLPDADGSDVVAHIRERTGMGVVILTARGQLKDRLKGYDAGADAYLIKPVDNRELAAVIRNISQRLDDAVPAPVGQRWSYARSSWSIVTPDNINIPLTASENALVDLLAAAGESGCGRGDLCAALGYRDEDSGRRNLENIVGRLRKKVRNISGQDIPLKTMHGVGYTFSSALCTIE